MDSVQQELAAIREEARSKGWQVDRGKKYWMMKCPPWCGKHLKTMKLTPSKGYPRNLRGQLSRATCWNDEPPTVGKEALR